MGLQAKFLKQMHSPKLANMYAALMQGLHVSHEVLTQLPFPAPPMKASESPLGLEYTCYLCGHRDNVDHARIYLIVKDNAARVFERI
jgi:hypothetical protein